MGMFDRIKKLFNNQEEEQRLNARIKELEAREPQVIIQTVIKEVEVIKEVPQQITELPTPETIQVPIQPPTPTEEPVEAPKVVAAPNLPSLTNKVTKRPVYVLNEIPFQDFCDKHRIHQKKAFERIHEADIGKIILPTGTGKTRIQVSVHIEDMITKTKAKKTGVYVIAAHRLALCKQLMGGTSYDPEKFDYEDFLDLAIKCGLNFDVLFVGSERYNIAHAYEHYNKTGYNKNICEATSTTSSFDIQKAYQSAKNNKRHLMVVSTYDSIDKLNLIPIIDIITYDEAHTIVSASTDKNDEDATFYNNITRLRADSKVLRNYFFTATPKILRRKGNATESEIDFDDSETPPDQIIKGGMDDVEFFGKKLILIKPATMVDKGEIVAPRFHFMEVASGDTDKYEVKSIIKAFTTHRKVVKQNSNHPDSLGAKLLITCVGSTELESIIENSEFRIYCSNNNIHVIAVMSKDNTNIYNDNDVYEFKNLGSKDKIIEKMDSLPDNADAIIFHIRMMTEGIDLPAITGVMPFRHLNISELMQTIGRAARLVKSDRKIIYKINDLKVEDTYKDYNVTDDFKATHFTKPVCYIIFPSHVDETVMTQALKKIRSEYGVPLEQLNFNSACKTSQPPVMPNIKPDDKSIPSSEDVQFNELVEKIRINDFNEILAKVKAMELRNTLTDLFAEG